MKYKLIIKKGITKATVYVDSMEEVENILKLCIRLSIYDADIMDELHTDLDFIGRALNDFKGVTISSKFGCVFYDIRRIENEQTC